MSASKALSFRKLAVSLAFASGVGTALAARTIIRCFSTASKLRLHLYDHCPFCIRIELVLGTYGIPYERVVYGYGDKKGPTALTGKKILPVLEGAGVPAPQGMKGLPESLDIIAYLTSKYKLPVPCGSDRKDLKHWVSEFDKVRRKLQRPRLIQMKVKDWANDEDVRYAKEKYTKENPNYYEEALKETPKLLEEANRLLMEFETLLKGDNALNPWGFGLDDVKILPNLRNMTCVQGIVWPEKVWNYVKGSCDKAGVSLYEGVP